MGIVGLAVLWGMLVYHLSVHWALNPQYGYGWFVPILALYLLTRRWSSRPAPAMDANRWATIAFIAGLVAIPPTWIIAQPNPDWRLLSWAFALETVAVTLAAVDYAGDGPWLRHFAFPVCFILIAIPWPTALENFVIQNLMTLVAEITVEGLNLGGIAAVRRGNLIEVETGLLGVDDACSGVRSLQATVMTALFLGELLRFRLMPRMMLVLSGVALAFLCNIGRATLLAFYAAKNGPEAISKWHDPAGYTILLICFAGLCAIAFALKRTTAPDEELESSPDSKGRQLPARFAYSLAGTLVVTFIITEGWYRMHEREDLKYLEHHWPADATSVPISYEARQLLQYDEGSAGRWRAQDQSLWHAFAFEWAPGARRSTILARMHRPDVCLPASGRQLRQDRATIKFDAAGQVLPFRSYTFESENGPLHVFFCVWRGTTLNEGEILQTENESFPRLRAVLRGERNPGEQVFEFVLSGYSSFAEAEASLRRELPSLIR